METQLSSPPLRAEAPGADRPDLLGLRIGLRPSLTRFRKSDTQGLCPWIHPSVAGSFTIRRVSTL
jgi:hypothetical protein